jgi:hypothetical protein
MSCMVPMETYFWTVSGDDWLAIANGDREHEFIERQQRVTDHVARRNRR